MSLEDLTTHTPAQQLKIDKLINYNEYFSDSKRIHYLSTGGLSTWVEFRDSLWGQDMPIVKTHEPTNDDEDLPNGKGIPGDEPTSSDEPLSEVAPVLRPVMEIPEDIALIWNLENRKFVVRSEYEETERAIMSANADSIQAFVVTGQPGIGKSVFLIWLLMRRLVLRLPTALQVREGEAVLFHEHGVSRFEFINNNIPYLSLRVPHYSTGRIWALVDSSQTVVKPAPLFQYGSPFLVVEAAPPFQPRLEWTKKVISQYFYMKLWTFSEVLQARPFLGLSSGGPYEEDQLWYLYNTYGATPRALSRYAHRPDVYRRLVTAQVDQMKPDALRSALQRPECQESSHLVTLIEPSPASRSDCEKRIASRGVLELLWNQHLKDQVSEMEYPYNLFRSSSGSASAAGWVFELRMHQLLRQGDSIQLFPIGRRSSESNSFYDDYTASEQGRDQEVLQLTASEYHPLNEEVRLRFGHYYRPQTTNFPTIDSLFLIHPPGEPSPTLLMFQITRNKTEHDVNEGGLCRIEKMKLPKNIRRYYVLVTPHNIQPKIKAPPATR